METCPFIHVFLAILCDNVDAKVESWCVYFATVIGYLLLQVIRGNSVGLLEALERIA